MSREKRSPTIQDPGDLFQRDAKRTMESINGCPLLSGVLAERVPLTTGVTRVPHNLGRVPVGFIIVDSTVDTRVWRPSAANSSTIPLTANTAVTVSLWIF